MTDLFGLEQTAPARKNSAPEAASLREVLIALRASPAVLWVERMNSGAAEVGGRFIRFGFRGCSDVLGQMRDGRLLAVEVKRPKGGRVSREQALFLELVRAGGGVAFVARDCRDVMKALAEAVREQ